MILKIMRFLILNNQISELKSNDDDNKIYDRLYKK